MLEPATVEWAGLPPHLARAFMAFISLFQDQGGHRPTLAVAEDTRRALEAGIPASWIAEIALEQGREDVLASVTARHGSVWLNWARALPDIGPGQEDEEDWKTDEKWLRVVEQRHKCVQEQPTLAHLALCNGSSQLASFIQRALDSGWEPRPLVGYIPWESAKRDVDALTLAALHGHAKTALVLLQHHSATPESCSRALMALVRPRPAHGPRRTVDEQCALATALLQQGADINAVCENGTTGDFRRLLAIPGYHLALRAAHGGDTKDSCELDALWEALWPRLLPEQWQERGNGNAASFQNALSDVLGSWRAAPTPRQEQAMNALAMNAQMAPVQMWQTALSASRTLDHGARIRWAAQWLKQPLPLPLAVAELRRRILDSTDRWADEEEQNVAIWRTAMAADDALAWMGLLKRLSGTPIRNLLNPSTDEERQHRTAIDQLLNLSVLPAAAKRPRARV